MNGTDAELGLAKVQRDQAIACAVLSLFIVFALVLSNIGREQETEQAWTAVREQRATLVQLQHVLRNNFSEFRYDRAALESLRREANR